MLPTPDPPDSVPTLPNPDTPNSRYPRLPPTQAIDPNHMVTIGEEGFYSRTCERVFLNPGAGKRRTGIASSPWALMEGQDYLANHRRDRPEPGYSCFTPP